MALNSLNSVLVEGWVEVELFTRDPFTRKRFILKTRRNEMHDLESKEVFYQFTIVLGRLENQITPEQLPQGRALRVVGRLAEEIYDVGEFTEPSTIIIADHIEFKP